MDNDLRAISFDRNKAPDWTTLKSHYWEKGRLVRAGLSGIEHYDLASFSQWVESARANGLASFQEEETDGSTHIMGNLAHRASHYQATIEGGSTVGVNSIQLLKHQGSWKIFSMLWDVPPPM